MDLPAFLNNQGSATQLLKKISKEYKLEVLHHGFVEQGFQRVVIIYLNLIPVIIGLSYANLNNKTFISILQKAKNTPIGNWLFAPHSKIIRKQMLISQIDIANIANLTIANYLKTLGYSKTTKLHLRQSCFSYHQEEMNLTEYILPGLTSLLNH